MPKSAIEAPATASTVDRLALGSEVIRGAGASTYSYTLPGPGCFEAEASYVGGCTCCTFIEAEVSTYTAGCAACCCFEAE